VVADPPRTCGPGKGGSWEAGPLVVISTGVGTRGVIEAGAVVGVAEGWGMEEEEEMEVFL